MCLLLLLHPALYSDFFHSVQIFNNMLMVAYSVYNVFAPELLQTGAGEIPALVAAGHAVRKRAIAEAIAATITAGGHTGREAAAASIGIGWAGAAEQAADGSGFGTDRHTKTSNQAESVVVTFQLKSGHSRNCAPGLKLILAST